MEDAKREKERFEYLFLDLEWNQTPGTTGLDGREAIQIGVVAADNKIQKIKTFSKAIRLSDPNLFNEKTEIITHTPVTNIMQGKGEDEEYQKTCKDYLQMIQEHGAETVQANLKNWLTETSELGCGDDITVVMAYFTAE